ncbi:DHH family phosphoesterase [Halodesulfurarchaeum formicicum]|uniref:DHH family phosphoesterase n=1 Tax=Halodesulfurarchaeum formicicum TaxID=1873524 RepID=UPI0008784292|nr:OB-fold nucleic acid binding domain-containing protein [Halodesulfurarchaeum formicicum]
MGTCVICGSPADGDVCSTHEEDVFFEFRGQHPNQLTPNRYYRGTVDGFAEFGVFVDIGPVTGLLHRSEIPKRLESLDWDAGDAVFVQVLDVHDNGNIDLGWSLRQEPREFRGRLIDDPDLGAPVLPEKADGEDDTEEPDSEDERGEPSAVDRDDSETSTTDGGQAKSAQPIESKDAEAEAVDETEPTSEETGTEAAEEPDTAQVEESDTESTADEEEPARVPVVDLDAALDETVVVEGTVSDVRQTAGPTVFQVEDETGVVDCAAFEEAGVRAYPAVEVDDVVRIVGIVEEHRGDVQVETEELSVLEGPAADRVADRRETALAERAEPTSTTLLVEDPSVAAIQEDLVAAATTIRRAVIESRPVVIRHTATLEGYVGGTALERALLPLIREEHAEAGAEYHYVDRRPLSDPIYDVEAATSDVTDMLEAADRHDETQPLFVLVDAGSTLESVDGLSLLSIYDAGSVVVDGGYADADATDTADVLVSPTAAGGSPLSTGVLGSHLAALVNDAVREDLAHLPATSFWTEPPEIYADLASDAGYDLETTTDIRNAVALEAFYQSYEDKRELISDLFWAEDNAALATPLSEQFETKLETELATACPHLERREDDGVQIDVLDVAEYTHRYDFPPTELLLAELHRREAEASGPMVTIALDEDELFLERSTALDVRAIGEAVADRVPGGGVTPRGGRDGRIEFLSGRREAVLEAVIEEVSVWLG